MLTGYSRNGLFTICLRTGNSNATGYLTRGLLRDALGYVGSGLTTCATVALVGVGCHLGVVVRRVLLMMPCLRSQQRASHYRLRDGWRGWLAHLDPRVPLTTQKRVGDHPEGDNSVANVGLTSPLEYRMGRPLPWSARSPETRSLPSSNKRHQWTDRRQRHSSIPRSGPLKGRQGRRRVRPWTS